MSAGAIAIWWTLEAAFIFLCVLGSSLLLLWVIAVVVSAFVGRPRRGNHRVGGVLKP
jgi:hypothetical protein